MTAAQLFLRRMLWRPNEYQDLPEPVVALLGPLGSGKTTTLDELSGQCGGTVVHARLDFADTRDIDPVSAVASVAFDLMRGWTNLRRDPTFHRVGLSLLALNEQLDTDRQRARKQIEALIREYVRGTRPGGFAEAVNGALSASVVFATALRGLGATPAGQAVQVASERAKPAIAALLRRAARHTLHDAFDYLRRAPNAEDANAIDSLIALSRGNRPQAVRYLMHALLADIDDNVNRHAELVTRCHCIVPADGRHRRHEHAWVLLLDNVDTNSGRRFLDALARARLDRATVPAGELPARDPLLVVAAVDRWTPAWGRWWREPWRSDDLGRPVPLFSAASRDQWRAHAADTATEPPNPAAGWYPVWLDPLTSAETAALAPVPAGRDEFRFDEYVSRLSGGRPSAVLDFGEQLDAGAALLTSHDPSSDEPLWQRAVRARLTTDVCTTPPWQPVPAPVVLAAALADPGRVSDDLVAGAFPEAARALRSLRRNLWISTFAARPSLLWPVAHADAAHPATVEPWLARCLLAGLATSDDGWDEVFSTLAGEPTELGHTLFHELARTRFDPVVDRLADEFDSRDHRDWIGLLDRVTSAPCRLPGVESTEDSFRRLVPAHAPHRTPTQAAVATVAALLWLYRDPLTVPDAEWNEHLRCGFLKLSILSSRSDVRALDEAAQQFAG